MYNNNYYNTKPMEFEDKLSLFIDFLEERDYMRFIEIPYLWQIYMEFIGKEIYETIAISGREKFILKEVSLIIENLNDELKFIEKKAELDKEFQRWQKKIELYEDSINKVQEIHRENPFDLAQNHEYRDLYKNIAYNIYPILNAKEEKKWKETMEAYKNIDNEKLKKIYLYCQTKDVIKKIDYEVLNNLDDYLDKIKHDIKKMKNSFPLAFREDILDYLWMEQLCKDMKYKNENLRKQMTLLREQVNLMKSNLYENKK